MSVACHGCSPTLSHKLFNILTSHSWCRREAGEPLPPPPKTAIAGPEYFGLTHPDVILRIESLDPERLCSKYWNGKQVGDPGKMHFCVSIWDLECQELGLKSPFILWQGQTSI